VVDHEKVDAAVRRLPRRATAATAAGLAVACVVLTAAPAVADQVRSQEWWLRALHVTTAQESSKGSGVTVAVLDTGVNPTQPDLAGSVTTGPDYTASGRKAGGPFWGISGTAVASLIAGHGHGPQNGDGIIGVAPAAKILSVRVTLEGNDPNLTKAGVAAGLPVGIAEGIRYAVSHGAQVIDLPLDPAALAAATPGGGTPTGGSTAAAPTPGGSTAERDAVAYALSKNVVLVAPGGDGGTGTDTVNYPAAYPNVISVGAFNQNFTKAPYTSHRPYVTLTAAGDGVIAATPTGYAMLHSTSAASAVVAGIAALIRAQFPTLSPAQVTSALTQSTVFRPPGGLRNGSGHGTADAQAALLAAAHINAAVPANSGSGGAVVAPSSPVVHPRGTGIYGTVRYAALGLAALLVLGLLGFLIAGRARRRRARLAPLRAVSRVAVRAQPDFSAVPPAAGAQFADSQITRPQSNRPQFPRSPFPGAQVPGAQVPEGQVSGVQLPGAQFPGGQFTEAPFPGDDYTNTPFPGDDYGLSPFPGDDYTDTPYAGNPVMEAPFSGDPFADPPFPEGSPADTAYPGSPEPETGPFAAIPPENGTASPPSRAVPPAPRSHLVRPPRISGAPPWESAEKPEGELPWSVTPPAKSVGRSTSVRRVIPTGAQPWGPATQGGTSLDGPDPGEAGRHSQGSESMVPDNAELGSRVPGSMPLPAPQSGRGESAENGSDDEEGSQKLYVWNPAEVTEAFPKVPPGEHRRK
jgi:subtilisin family serine protease